MQIFSDNGTCRRCGDCVGADHHWLDASFDPHDTDDYQHREDVLLYWLSLPDAERPVCPVYWACKHCAAWTPDDPSEDGEE